MDSPALTGSTAPDRSWRRFAITMLASTLAALAAVAGINAWADPPQAASLAVGDVIQSDGKVQLLLRSDPADLDFVILGTSPIQRYDPEVVTRETGATGFNAAIAASPLTDAVEITRWLAERAEDRGESMPHVVYGLTLEATGGPQPREARSIGLPGATPEAGLVQRTKRRLDRASELVQWSNLKRSVRIIAGGEEARRELEGDLGVDAKVRDDGYLTDGPFIGPLANVPPEELEARTRDQFLAAYQGARGRTHRVHPDADHEFRELLELANAAGDRPTILLAPMSEELAELLGPISRDEYVETVDEWLEDLADDHEFQVVRAPSAKDAGFDDQRGFYDGVHPRPAFADEIVERLAAEDEVLASRGGGDG